MAVAFENIRKEDELDTFMYKNRRDLLKSTDNANNNEVITLLYCMQVKVNKQIINVPSVSNISNEEIEDIKLAIDKINNALLALI